MIGSARLVSTRTISSKVERARQWRLKSAASAAYLARSQAHDQLQRPLNGAMTESVESASRSGALVDRRFRGQWRAECAAGVGIVTATPTRECFGN